MTAEEHILHIGFQFAIYNALSPVSSFFFICTMSKRLNGNAHDRSNCASYYSGTDI